MAAHTDPREVAAQVVRRVLDDGAYSQLALRVELDRAALDGRDRAFATALVYETLTWLGRIDAALDARLPKGLRSLRPDMRARMRVAAAQILSSSLRTPGWAARAEAVKATREPTLRRVVDAVLRRIEPVEPPADLDRIGLLAHHGSVPRWIAEHLDAALGLDAAAACDGFNAPTPATVRMRRDGERDTMVAALGAAGLDAVAHPIVPTAIVVRHGDVARTAEHARGEVIVQDAGAQLATLALPPRLEDGAPVLDVAAGLGGKSLHLASRYGSARVIAVDRDLDKLLRMREHPDGHGVSVARWELPAPPPAGVADRAPYAAVLLDAPCSALGTIGRHPEVRWNRKPEIVEDLAATQAAMLRACAPLVAPGGWLLYCVCTFTRAETVDVVRAFLAENDDFALAPPSADDASPDIDWAALVDEGGALALWPHRHGTDGFWIARLRRRATAPGATR
jgi:16S rRNA (cytosine967-C5)-methyltransferase